MISRFRRFQSKISTLRGQQKHLVGKGNQKVLKELKLPSLEQRNARQNAGIAELDLTAGPGAASTGLPKGIFFNMNATRVAKQSMLIKKKPTLLMLEKQKQLEKSLFTIEKAERKESVLPNVDVTSMLRPTILNSIKIEAAKAAAGEGGGRKRTTTIALKRNPTKIGRASTILNQIPSPNRQSRLTQQHRPTSSPIRAQGSMITEEKSDSNDPTVKGEDSTVIDDPNNPLKKIHHQHAKKFLHLVNNKNLVNNPSASMRSSTASPPTARQSTIIAAGRPSTINNSAAINRMTQRMSVASQQQPPAARKSTFSPNQPRQSNLIATIPERSRLNINTNSLAGGSTSLVLSEQPSNMEEGNSSPEPSPLKARASTIKPSFPLFASKSSALINRSESITIPSPVNKGARKTAALLESSVSTETGEGVGGITENLKREGTPGKNEGVSRPSSVGVKKKSIVKREDLARELIQSRKVSRLLPIATEGEKENKDSSAVVAVSQPRLTKRRQTNQENQKIL